MSSLKAIEKIFRIRSATQVSSFVRAVLTMYCAVTLSGATVSDAADDAIWSIDISVEELVGDTIGGERFLTLGTDPVATGGIDLDLGEMELPPDPPSGLHAAFIGIGLGNGLRKDLRSSSEDTLVYTVK